MSKNKISDVYFIYYHSIKKPLVIYLRKIIESTTTGFSSVLLFNKKIYIYN